MWAQAPANGANNFRATHKPNIAEVLGKD